MIWVHLVEQINSHKCLIIKLPNKTYLNKESLMDSSAIHLDYAASTPSFKPGETMEVVLLAVQQTGIKLMYKYFVNIICSRIKCSSFEPTYRKLMGVEDGKYEVFRDLNKRVINPSVAEVNNRAAIRIKPEFKKQGRAVMAIRFLINKQIENEAISQIEEGEFETIVDRLIENYGCSAKQAQDFINSYNEQYLLDKMALIESSASYRAEKIGHLSKYLEKALNEDYQPPKSSRQNLERLRIKREKEAVIRKLHEEKMQKYRSYQNRELPKVLIGLPNKQKLIIEKNFDNYIQTTLYYSLYVKERLNNSLVRDRLGDFVRESYPELLVSLLSFEEFCKIGQSLTSSSEIYQ